MDSSQIAMNLLTIVVGNAAIIIPLFLWIRSEANSDRRDMCALVREMKSEMKDFHGRLCSIEEKYHQLDRRIK